MTRYCHGKPVWGEKSQRKTSLGLMEFGPPKFAAFVSTCSRPQLCRVLAETEFIGVRGENSLFFQPSASLPLEKVPVNPRQLDAARIIHLGLFTGNGTL
jgi:hypothetical protein